MTQEILYSTVTAWMNRVHITLAIHVRSIFREKKFMSSC